MRERLQVSTDAHGVPHAKVPSSCLWDLVEYLSYQRVAVSYHYEATHFTVTFPRQEPRGAQKIMDEWIASEATPSQMPQSVQVRRNESTDEILCGAQAFG